MSRKALMLAGIVLGVVLVGCREPTAVLLEPLPTSPDLRAGSSSGWIQVYFSEPDDPTADQYRGGPDAYIAQAIEEARFQVDLAVYDLNLWSVREALIDAHQRGVVVRVVTERDNFYGEEIQDLTRAGIHVIVDQGQGLMHQKFLVIDGQHVWTGSMNYTLSGAYRNDNNLIHIHSKQLADNYMAEFEEMFEHHLFGDDYGEMTPYPYLDIQGARVETLFSPDDHPQRRILELIEGAEEEIFFLVYTFTSDPIAIALIQKASEGVTVRGVMEASQSYTGLGGERERLMKSDVDIRQDGNPHKMHHKCILIDQKVVVTGSYNFTQSAEERNDENVLVIHDSRVAQEFIGEFWRVYAQGRY